jgi:iron complex outermembrane receptor protein
VRVRNPKIAFAIAVACGALSATCALAAEEEQIEAVVVTGTRIRANEFDAPAPTISVSAEAIENAGVTNLTEFLRQQPALVGSYDSNRTTNSYIGYNGLNLLNLRNLGTDRTLVLVDGRRHIAQVPQTASVDVNSIPTDLIERVDVVTGGVSAVYGADAVSGVVNFVMKKNFEGVIGRVQYGAGDGGAPEDVQAALTAGFNFADGRGNLSGSIEHTREGRLRSSDRSYLHGKNYTSLQRNPNDLGDDPNVPDRIPLNDVRYIDTARAGGIDIDFDGLPDLLPDGSPFVIGTEIPPYFMQGGSGTPVADYIGELRSENESTIGSLFLNYSFNDSANLFAELKFARSTGMAYYQPTFDFYLYIPAENPFISPAVAAAAPDGFLMNRDNFDLGVRGEDNTRDTFRSVIGLNGDIFGGDYRYEASYVFGQTDVKTVHINNRYNDRFLAALDVVTDPNTGLPTCRSNLDPTALPDQPYQGFDFSGELSFTPGPGSGCVPLNLLGEGVADPAAINWIMLNSIERAKLTQHVVNAYLSGPVPGITLPAGTIDAVAGVEWRRETSEANPPIENQKGLTFGNAILPTDGDFDVKEAFVEIRVPLLKDAPFAELLQVTGALRQSDYSTVGSTTTWNAGALWAPVSDISFRGTVSESVRAPNIGELFSPQSETFEFIDDPCDIANVNNGTQYRAANCAALLSQLGIDPTSYTDPNSSNISGLQKGNANLQEETSRSYTLGAVLRPRFVPGLAIAIDYYDINIKNAISTAEAQDIADTCVDQPTLDNVFCEALTRDPTKGGIDSFILQPENVASYRTRGIDFNLSYVLNPVLLGIESDIGQFRFSLVGNRLDRLTMIPTLGAEQVDERTTAYAPKWQTSFDTTWYYHGLTVNYGYSYFSKTTRYSLLEIAAQPDIASPDNIYYDAFQQHDLHVAYDFDDAYQVYAGVRNFTDERPDYSTTYPISAVGRFVYGGFRVNFGL